ncbi:MAG: hypothetical protein HYV09_00730 [Deltaproteobacteria bacterium]|nr:hypothetical protein [Deltaproteobacteria bacterium]
MLTQLLSRVSMVGLFAVVAASPTATHAAEAVEEPSPACPLDDGDATPLAKNNPMCTYLSKCCAGGTDKARQCCAAYLKRCGD